jgi:hypothetical protein
MWLKDHDLVAILTERQYSIGGVFVHKNAGKIVDRIKGIT